MQANATTIDYGFTLTANGNAQVSGITVSVKYVNTANQVVTTTPVLIPNSSTNNTLTICNSFLKPSDIITTGASANSYQLIFTITATGNGNSNTFITIDDYRTSSTVSLIVLPVRFSSFTIKAVSNGASLSWNIEAEENVREYEVERSVDGKSFSKIGSVAATGTGSYSFGDGRMVAGASYYRIKSLSLNEQFNYSPILSLKNGKSSVVFKGFPTLTHGLVTLQHDAATVSAIINVSSIEGRIIKSIIPASGTQQTIVDLTSVQPGVYFVRYNNGNGSVETVKIIKQ